MVSFAANDSSYFEASSQRSINKVVTDPDRGKSLVDEIVKLKFEDSKVAPMLAPSTGISNRNPLYSSYQPSTNLSPINLIKRLQQEQQIDDTESASKNVLNTSARASQEYLQNAKLRSP